MTERKGSHQTHQRNYLSSQRESFVVSAGLDCLLIFSNYQTGEIIKTINTDNSFVFDISIREYEDGIFIATASQDGVIRIYDANNEFQCIRELKQSSIGVCEIVWAVQLFSDRLKRMPYCISAGATKIIHVTNWKTGDELFSLSGHKEGIRCLAISEDGVIASGSNDHSVKLWSFSQQKFIQTLRGHTAEVNAVVFVPFHPYLLTACENNLFRIWNYGTGERIRVIDGYDGTSILSLSIIPSQSKPMVLVGGTVSERAALPLVSLQIWDILTGTLIGSCTGTRYQISSVAVWYEEDEEENEVRCVIVGGGLDSTIRIWEINEQMIPGMRKERVKEIEEKKVHGSRFRHSHSLREGRERRK
jgi:WD40 repeat protein